MDYSEIGFYCLLTSILWGATNPLIRKTTTGILKIQSNDSVPKFFGELNYLITNWRYMLLFSLNQIGSIVYIILLQNVDLSLIVPSVNAFSFLMTAITGVFTNEQSPSLRNSFGIILILCGITSCIFDKAYIQSHNK